MRSVWPRMVSLALGSSMAAIAAGTAAPALAQCAPDPTVANGTTNCAGTDADGLRIDGANSTVIVEAGATVRPGSAQAAVLAQSTSGTLVVRGAILGADRPGMLGLNGSPRSTVCDPYAGASVGYCPSPTIIFSPQSSTTVTVDAGGVIDGTAAILLSRPTAADTGFVAATITNSGRLTGSAGPAVVAGPNTRIDRLENRAGGFIGGVSGDVSALTNAGTIDGGARAAIAAATPFFSAVSVTNSGLLTAASGEATLSSAGTLFATNTGTIRNTGSGPAVRSGSFASMTNGATGTIAAATAAGVALLIGDGLSLTNNGSIIGSIVVSAGGSRPTTIDTTLGTIAGDVRLDRTDDRLIVRYDRTTNRTSSISGAIDGGGGVDTLQFRIDGDATLDASTMPLNFERLEVQLANAPAVTLAPGFNATGGLQAIGDGVVTNRAALTATVGPAISLFGTGTTTRQAVLVNEGGIALNMAPNPFASVSAVVIATGSLDNRGAITATGGNGVSVSSFSGGTSTNSGRITATGTGATVFGVLNNSGTIESSGGVGLSLSGSGASGVASVNTGTISGATAGVRVYGGSFENSGVVSGATGVLFEFGGLFVNAAAGVVSGSTAGVRGDGYSMTTFVNRGRVEGAVDMTAGGASGSQDRFVDEGGVVTGAIRLGGGDDLLVTDLVAIAGRPLAGATGGVDAGAGTDTIRYRVRETASAVASAPASFEISSYELSNGATLTLTAPAPLSTGVGFAGEGVADLAVDVSLTDKAALDLTLIPSDQLVGTAPFKANALDVTSRGALSLTVVDGSFVSDLTAVRAGGAQFENAGSITVKRSSTSSQAASAVSGGQSFYFSEASVLNSGTITLDGANLTGVLGVAQFTNTGRITGTGGPSVTGVSGVSNVVNSGVIEVSGTGVSLPGFSGGPGTLVNSGSIASTSGVAVRGAAFGSLIDNRAGGIIAARVAIVAEGSTVFNAGTITGMVQLGASPFGGPSFASGAFVSAGGTVQGDVRFGAGNDLFLQIGDATGVTGVIDGGDGFDVYGRGYSGSATVALGTLGGLNFEAELVQARGADSVVTLTADAPVEQDVFVGGDGRIVNQATVNALVTTEPPLYGYGFFGQEALKAIGLDLALAEFRNEGTLNGGFYGQVRSFINTGTVGFTPDEDGGVRIDGTGDVSFDNSGTIAGSDGAVGVDMNQATRVSIVNSGAIDGGVYGEVSFAGETPGRVTVANSGTISAAADSFPALDLYVKTFEGAGSLLLTNEGQISSAGALGVQISIDGDKDGGFAIVNNGLIEATGAGSNESVFIFDGMTAREVTTFTPGRALSIYGGGGAGGTVVNSGVIAATGADSVALLTTRTALLLENSGLIQGGAGVTRTPSDFPITIFDTLPYLAGAVQSLHTFDDRIRNTGQIVGSIDLGAGADRIENRGLIDGAVFLRAGDDRYLQGAGGSLTGVVDGGDGTDVIEIDAVGGGTVSAERFANFERLTQSGAGAVAYSGAFSTPTLELSGGTMRVEAGRSFATAGAVAVMGSDAAESVEVAGTLGAVMLGGGDDLFVEIGEGRATGLVDGGEGVDQYRVTLAGDRAGLSANTGFERLGVDGAGTLSLVLQQNFESASLSGTGLDLLLDGFAINAVDGSAGSERLGVDGDVARVSMGDGDDSVRLGGTTFAGLYDGGTGVDLLRFAGSGPATLSGVATGFETVTVDGGALLVTGALGATTVSFGDGAQSLTVADGGRLQGAFDLGMGNDRFQLATGGLLAGSVAGGAGRDAASVSLAGDRAFGANTLTGFELLSVDGVGTLSLTLDQSLEAISLNGVGLDVRLAGFVIGAIEGGANAERLVSDGDVARVALGAGDDFLSIGGGTLAGAYDGGAGTDTLRFVGATMLTGRAVGFEALALDQATTLTVRGVLGAVGERLAAGDGADAIVNAGRIDASLDLGGGDDLYAETAGAVLGGAVDGGAGTDLYRVTLAGDRTGLSTHSGFERLLVDGAGTLSLTLQQGFERVTLSGVGFDARLNGFTIGAVEGGSGADRLLVDGDVARVAMGGGDDVVAIGAATVAGSYDGGAGTDWLRLTRASTLTAGRATGFEFLSSEAPGGLTLTGGAFAFGQIDAIGDLRIAADSALSGAVRFGGGDNRFEIAGGYAGSVAGGAGSDVIEISGGSAATPVAFGSITEVEAFRMTRGYATLSGTGALGSVDLSGGRLVGLAGSVMTASAFTVRRGATFGSAGRVSGNVAIAGTLSPGASSGTMTVDGNVALAGTSVSVFEITPMASDRLVVNGAVSIANGATLQIVPTGQLLPGASLDLITATGGITGSFINVVKPDSLFGFLVQQSGRLSLLGQFRNDASFTGQVGRTIDYTNAVLVSGRANAALLAAAPGLVGANGTSNAGAFALLAPEAYASARQAAVEQGLTLADAGRSAGFASRRTEPGLFTFGQSSADQRTLRADADRGAARARFGGYGLFGGLGYAGDDWSLGGFAGYLDGRQRLDGRGATTEIEGATFGVHGRAAFGAFGLMATAAYAATDADTRRALPGGSARGRYDLTNLTLDVAVTYEAAIGGDWALKPRIGGTVVRVQGDAVAETGSTAFAAQVGKGSDTAAFVDGTVTVTRSGSVRPFATFGLRYQAAGRASSALTGFGGGGLGLVVEGAERARLLGTAALGVEADLQSGVTLSSAVAAERGEDDRRESARIGVRFAF
ncbi:autotransporter outer membrane beta-barrel domain-containing protein [Sphingomonas sp. SUN019]|uniref:beta strand repeat-containing protein n=1 Tax=Sphingomonas sp. SUN019 TaxID=2937788 RepID=UPI00216492A6|nr:autotransporter outer membrane beta-barrel domain-containing protein [Sphingomonas sp. SUN019]UVO49735.1 autotransporter outer membrane beta-barrel domain-containing protein [Sphingomonas sp. SUN019]